MATPNGWWKKLKSDKPPGDLCQQKPMKTVGQNSTQIPLMVQNSGKLTTWDGAKTLQIMGQTTLPETNVAPENRPPQ